MRRRISLLLAAVLAGTTLMMLGPARPASAIQVCGGSGSVTVLPGLLYPILFSIGNPTTGQPAQGLDHLIDILIFDQTNALHAFIAEFDAGACVHVNTPPTMPTITDNPRGGGVLKGYCGHSSGHGTFLGQPFAYVSLGTFLVVTGHLVGLGNAIPVPGTGSCLHVGTNPPTATFGLPGGATQFAFNAAAVGMNCLNALPPAGTLVTVPGTTLFLPTQTFGVHVGPHIAHIWTMGTCPPSLNHLPK